MPEFAQLFRETFPELPADSWSAVLQSAQYETTSYLRLRTLPTLPLDEAVQEAISAARGPLPTHLRPQLTRVMAAVADLVISTGSDVQSRIRRLIDALLTNSPEPHRSAELAVAAVMHARSGDGVLARARLRDLHAGDTDIGVRARQLAEFAEVLLGGEPRQDDVAELMMGLEDRLWSRFLTLPDEKNPRGTDYLIEYVRQCAEPDADDAFRSVVEVLGAVPAISGRTRQLTLDAPALLTQAEELLWLCTRPRGPLWSDLAYAAAMTGDEDLALRAEGEAFLAQPEVMGLTEMELSRTAGNLLEARRTSERLWWPLQDPPASAEPVTDVRPVEPLPGMLGTLLATSDVILVAGPDLPTARGGPGRDAVLAALAEDEGSLSSAAQSHVLAGIEQGYLDRVAPLLRAGRQPVEATVRELYAQNPDPSAYRTLASIPFRGLVNLSWDGRLREAFEPRSPLDLRVGGERPERTASLQEGFAFTWLAGDPAVEEIAIGPLELRRKLSGDETTARFLNGAMQSSPLLFLGVRASDVVDFFETLGAAGMSADQPRTMRYAVCVRDDLWDFNRDQLRLRYGVELIGYDPGDDQALTGIIRRLAGEADLAHSPDSTSHEHAAPRLNRVTLTNIGAFEQLDLSLAPGWNLLLGNNGCGKSTVLRAVALGLCGDHPSAVEAGAELLRAGCDQGAIELHVGKERFRTELVRSAGAVRVRTGSLTPLQLGHWAVLGFPALRGLSLSTPSGMSSTQAPEPRVEDLLPLLRGAVDTRLDDIKQWIVNVEARSRQPQPDGERWRQLLDRFFLVLRDLTPGGTLEFDSVDPASWEVWVRTDDGVVSIDRLSQGMNSIIAWVGNLLQRMYDIYESSPEPAGEGAFVLIDELDAHLHPEWQRRVPGLTREHFPRVQFLATSHSPLVASSLDRGELFVASRRGQEEPDGTVRRVARIAATDFDPKGLRADQILTSPLFGMVTSRSPEYDDSTTRYTELFLKSSRTAEEETELQALGAFIANRHRDGESEPLRAAEEAAAAKSQEPLVAPEVGPSGEQVEELRELLGVLDAVESADTPPEQPGSAS